MQNLEKRQGEIGRWSDEASKDGCGCGKRDWRRNDRSYQHKTEHETKKGDLHGVIAGTGVEGWVRQCASCRMSPMIDD